MVYRLDAVLLLIGLVNLLTTLLLGPRARPRLRDLQVVGLTPRQVRAAVTSGASVHALLAALVGIPVGAVVFDWGWRSRSTRPTGPT